MLCSPLGCVDLGLGMKNFLSSEGVWALGREGRQRRAHLACLQADPEHGLFLRREHDEHAATHW